ncbi:hypothetical protein NA57DRAFT_74691 [Rhizodiscina lignyota]|uniref:Uncharacterized protein n=1 Tax=Rhizodiscina lignyota TaxID=1504668 RepID=A0A9P4IJG4_9PEZI|nr:hypothetical protein NA57DRAFT_74691 [Rhizodiscina lignyota]
MFFTVLYITIFTLIVHKILTVRRVGPQPKTHRSAGARNSKSSSSKETRRGKEKYLLAAKWVDALVEYRDGVLASAASALDEAEAALLAGLRGETGQQEQDKNNDPFIDKITARSVDGDDETNIDALVRRQMYLHRPIGDEVLRIVPKSSNIDSSAELGDSDNEARKEPYETTLGKSFSDFAELIMDTETSLASFKKEWEDICGEVAQVGQAIVDPDRKDGAEAEDDTAEKEKFLEEVRAWVDELVKDATVRVDAEEKAKKDGMLQAKKALWIDTEAMEREK